MVFCVSYSIVQNDRQVFAFWVAVAPFDSTFNIFLVNQILGSWYAFWINQMKQELQQLRQSSKKSLLGQSWLLQGWTCAKSSSFLQIPVSRTRAWMPVKSCKNWFASKKIWTWNPLSKFWLGSWSFISKYLCHMVCCMHSNSTNTKLDNERHLNFFLALHQCRTESQLWIERVFEVKLMLNTYCHNVLLKEALVVAQNQKKFQRASRFLWIGTWYKIIVDSQKFGSYEIAETSKLTVENNQ